MNRRSQEDRIICWLATGKTLTHAQAESRFGCARLAARIEKLRDRHRIITNMVKTRTGKRVAQYQLCR